MVVGRVMKDRDIFGICEYILSMLGVIYIMEHTYAITVSDPDGFVRVIYYVAESPEIARQAAYEADEIHVYDYVVSIQPMYAAKMKT